MIIRLQIANLIYYFVSIFFFFNGNFLGRSLKPTCSSRKVGNYWLPRFTFRVVSKACIFKQGSRGLIDDFGCWGKSHIRHD